MSYAASANPSNVNERLQLLSPTFFFNQYDPFRRNKFTTKARRAIRESGGWVNGEEVLDASTGIAFNPLTNRIVPRSSLYRNNGQARAKLVKATRAYVDAQIDRVIDTQDDVKFDYTQLQMLPGGALYVLERLPVSMRFLIFTQETSTYTHFQGGQQMAVAKGQKQVTTEDTSRYYAFHSGTREELMESLGNPFDAIESETKTSDAQTTLAILARRHFIVSQVTEYGQIEGAFFPYLINHSLPTLAHLGIHSAVNSEAYNESCFILALRASGLVEPQTIDTICSTLKGSFVPHNKMRAICERFKLNLEIVGAHKNNTTQFKYGGESPTIRLGLLAKHYFLNEQTDVTKYAIEHVDELKPRDDLRAPWWQYRSATKPEKARGLNSVKLVRLLTETPEMRAKWLTEIPLTYELMATPYFKSASDEVHAHEPVEEDDYLEIKPKFSEDGKPLGNACDKYRHTRRVFFDFETITSGAKHVPYLCSYITDDGHGATTRTEFGPDCGRAMMKRLTRDLKRATKGAKGDLLHMFAHNMSYDFTVGLFGLEGFTVQSSIERGSSVLAVNATYYGMPVLLHDTYAKIGEPLRKFGKMFDLEQSKEVMPYGVYTPNNIKKIFVPLAECLTHLNDDEHQQFEDNASRWGYIRRGNVDILAYSKKYCEIDCDVMYRGYEKFREYIGEICDDLDPDNFVSAASISDTYLHKAGCYRGVYSLGGLCRTFVQRCLVGGRTMCAENQKQNVKGERVADFDAVSLYPSAMHRLPGYLLGAPRLVKGEYLNLSKLLTTDGFYIRARVKKVGKHQRFPLLSYKSDAGVRVFSNDMEGREVFIDKTAVEDAIEFQKIEFEVLEGYFFNDGFNPKIREVIRGMFLERLKMKAIKNPIQNVYKLLMNSSYGKTALKEINEEVQYVDNKNFKKTIAKRYNWVKSATPTACGKRWRIVLTKAINEHLNQVHVGIQILSMSKRIMNEVMGTAEDIGAKIFYQDTDSTHITEPDVKRLCDAFGDKYGRDLLGEDMGQFNSDFEMSGCTNVYSEHMICLGKKSYIDCLVGTDTKTGEIKKDFHIRMKGVPSGAIEAWANSNGCTLAQLYSKMFNGEAVTFDLSARVGSQCAPLFKKTAAMEMKSVGMCRTVSF